MRRFFHGDTKKFAVQLCNLHQSDNRHETLELKHLCLLNNIYKCIGNAKNLINTEAFNRIRTYLNTILRNSVKTVAIAVPVYVSRGPQIGGQ